MGPRKMSLKMKETWSCFNDEEEKENVIFKREKVLLMMRRGSKAWQRKRSLPCWGLSHSVSLRQWEGRRRGWGQMHWGVANLEEELEGLIIWWLQFPLRSHQWECYLIREGSGELGEIAGWRFRDIGEALKYWKVMSKGGRASWPEKFGVALRACNEAGSQNYRVGPISSVMWLSPAALTAQVIHGSKGKLGLPSFGVLSGKCSNDRGQGNSGSGHLSWLRHKWRKSLPCKIIGSHWWALRKELSVAWRSLLRLKTTPSRLSWRSKLEREGVMARISEFWRWSSLGDDKQLQGVAVEVDGWDREGKIAWDGKTRNQRGHGVGWVFHMFAKLTRVRARLKDKKETGSRCHCLWWM